MFKRNREIIEKWGFRNHNTFYITISWPSDFFQLAGRQRLWPLIPCSILHLKVYGHSHQDVGVTLTLKYFDQMALIESDIRLFSLGWNQLELFPISPCTPSFIDHNAPSNGFLSCLLTHVCFFIWWLFCLFLHHFIYFSLVFFNICPFSF